MDRMNRAAGTGLAPAAPLSVAGLRAALGPGSMWAELRVLAQTGSTNADVLAAAGGGAPEGLVIAAETQTAGRGRQGRGWTSMPGGALTFSVLLRPQTLPRAAHGWLPLLAGVAVVTALRDVTSVDARLKWPNDVLVDGGKLAGILAEQQAGAVVAGIGINVLGQRPQLPTGSATSLEAHGAGGTDRTVLLAEILRQFEHWYSRLSAASGDPDACGLRAEYLHRSATIGRQVRVELPGDKLLAGRAIGVDQTGRLLVEQADGELVPVSAGDVIHVRPAR
jgi:BirA family transcriptional regulator, biotin operon repressor / biotin---[acetyl-CoA-carboxylase] ligase